MIHPKVLTLFHLHIICRWIMSCLEWMTIDCINALIIHQIFGYLRCSDSLAPGYHKCRTCEQAHCDIY